MIEVPITEAAIGSTIAAPVYSADGTLLVIDGASVSAQILKMLPKFGIEKIYVSEIFKETIDEKLMKGQLDNLTYLAIRKLNINEIAKCANILVTNIMNNKEYPLLSVLFDVDEDTAKHSFNVACLVLNAAIQMNYSLSELHNLAVGAFMHDIGKLDIPKEILHKPEKLTDEEYEIVKKHVLCGFETLEKTVGTSQIVKEIALQHHENFDGTGYPRQLKDFHICKQARLVHIADVYEALCAKRSYKPALPRTVVRQIMQEGSGTMFDPFMLNKFLQCTPLCLLGEELEINGRVGIVVDVDDKENPLINTAQGTMTLHEFENLSDIVIEEYLYNYNALFKGKGGHFRA